MRSRPRRKDAVVNPVKLNMCPFVNLIVMAMLAVDLPSARDGHASI